MPGGGLAETPRATDVVPTIRRRMFSLAYEGVLLFGVVFISGYLYSALTRFKGQAGSSLYFGFQATIFIAIGLYFVLSWRKGGQTLPMKTWKFRLASTSGARPALAQCWARYVLAWLGPLAGLAMYKVIVLLTAYGMTRFSLAAFFLALPVFAFNFIWALVDREQQFLHDRLARTRLIFA